MATFTIILAALSFFAPFVALIGNAVSHFAFNMQWGWSVTFFEIMDVVFFLFPMYDLWPLLVMIIAIGVVRFLIALLRTVLDIIPLT